MTFKMADGHTDFGDVVLKVKELFIRKVSKSYFVNTLQNILIVL